MEERHALLVLNHVPGMGAVKIRLLVERMGSAIAVLKASPQQLQQEGALGRTLAEKVGQWKSLPSWRRDLELVTKEGAELVEFRDPRFPEWLLKIPDFPPLLYVKGKLQAQDNRGLAVVGTRQPSIYGQSMAEKIGRELTGLGFTVVSGLARGVDTLAHRGALEGGGRTVAVIGSGLARLYPSENKMLAQTIEGQGAVVSEYPMETPPDRRNFPARNRLVSGMTLGSVLIEAPEKSGAMITMRRALAQGRRLFAIPGRADGEGFRGNHLLIRKGEAQLIERGADVAEALGEVSGFHPLKVSRLGAFPSHLDPEEADFVGKLPPEELNIEEIGLLTKLPIAKLSVLLMSLVLKNVIKEYPGKVYKKCC